MLTLGVGSSGKDLCLGGVLPPGLRFKFFWAQTTCRGHQTGGIFPLNTLDALLGTPY